MTREKKAASAAFFFAATQPAVSLAKMKGCNFECKAMKKLLALSLSSVFLVVGCGSKEAALLRVDDPAAASIPVAADWAAAQGKDGKLWISYYDKNRYLHVITNQDAEAKLPFHAGDGEKRASSGLAMAVANGEPFVAFRDKEPERDVFVGAVGRDSPAVLRGLGTETVPLARLKLQPMAGGLAAVWLGEKGDGKGAQFHAYYRETDREGRPTGDAVQLVEGIYPAMAIAPSNKVTVFGWTRANGKDVVLAQTKLPGQSFGEAKKVAEIAPITPFFEALSDRERAFAFWHAQYGADKRDFRLEGAFSDDGNNWSRFHLKGLDGLDVETADLASDGNGNLALVASVIHPDEFKTGKFRVVLLLSHDRGATWSDPIELRSNHKFADKSYSHARAPKVAFVGESKLFVAWQDWRALRSAVHASYSEDAGRTWVFADQRLTESFKLNEQLSTFGKSIFVEDGNVTLISEVLNGDSLTEKKLKIRAFTRDDLSKFKGVSEGKLPDSSQLATRSESYWRALAKKDFDEAYKYFDPYFRAKVGLEDYKKMAGRIEYGEPSTKVADTIGPLGMVVTQIRVEVKPFVVQNKTLKLDAHERDIPTRWLWIDDGWYLEYSEQSRERKFTPF